MIEYYFQCPYCWLDISVLLDPSVDQQCYIEDCENCCNPMEITVSFQDDELLQFNADSIDQ